jgi:hypothetical protein
MDSNHNEIGKIISQKKDYEVHLFSSNSRCQNNLTKPEDEVEHCVQKINDENKVTTKANHETKKEQEDNFNIKLYQKFEKSLINFLEYSTIGGLSEVGRRKELYLRLFWMIVVFICSSYALVTFIEKFKVYYKYKVNLVFDRYQEMPTNFPAITFCNQNPFNEQYSFKYLKDKFNFILDYGFYAGNQEHKYLSESEQTRFSKYVQNPTVNQLKRTLINDLNQTELSRIGYDLDTKILISCQFNGHSCSEKNGDFKRFWNNIYGNCYTFNGGNNSYLTGDQNGLHLEMIVSK